MLDRIHISQKVNLDMKYKVVYANIINPISDKKCQFFKDGALVLKEKKGIWLVDYIGKRKKEHGLLDADFYHFDKKIIMPSFFDMHFHWVQDDVREMPKAHLLEWLDKYTFPTENKFKNKSFAKKKAKFFFDRLVKTGTLGGAVYSSIHEHALEYAFDEVKGDFIIGNVQMTMNSPKFLTQTKENALDIANRMSKKYKHRYALTPRFAITTDPETMKKSGQAVKKNKSFIQTHLSENKNEIEFVNHLYKNELGFSKTKNYTDIYNNVGLLTSRTIMGHGIYLDDSELDVLSKTKTSIAHCPTSNAPIKEKGLGSGLFNFKKTERKGIRWALGSDIGGGPFLSMFDVIRSFVDQNTKAGIKATYKKALYRATLAGAEILNIDNKKGNLEVGKEANFIVLNGVIGQKDKDLEATMKTIINRGRKDRSKYDSLPEKVFYQGKCLFNQEEE